jgi:hypothetical protein
LVKMREENQLVSLCCCGGSVDGKNVKFRIGKCMELEKVPKFESSIWSKNNGGRRERWREKKNSQQMTNWHVYHI